ncbi:3-hydroxyacyl-CoA dehydrogenase protein [Teladorsagia circumcincta]|uniref:3-hydroxyacyl-CoA dehydrogenase protein n=1 Tax=Teladorsagia circumcincta TaxID=45464 RepID=A0A2G9UIE6_TELCI|nr:3-hydroxyacyl-CoA dehydrogenase protein [Teladorsagia circumcincta]
MLLILQSLEICRRELTTTYAREKKLGRLTSLQCEKLENGIHLTTDLNSLKNCDLAQKLLYQYGMFPNDVDALFKSFGLIMGPLTVADMNGLDIAALLKGEHNYPLNPIEKELLHLNRLGRKTGKGFYSYDSATQKKSNDMEVEAIIRRLAAESTYNIQLLCDSVGS